MRALAAIALWLATCLFSFGAVGTWNGIAFTHWNGIAQTSWNGTSISCGGAPANGLLTNLRMYYDLDEASGNLIDIHSTNDLTDNNTVTSAAGKLGTARQFTATNSEFGDRAMVLGAGSFTVSCWVYIDADNGGSQQICNFSHPTNFTIDTYLRYSGDGGAFQFNAAGGVAAWGSSASTGTWYHVAGWYDAGDDTANISVNNGTPVSVAAASPTTVGSHFYISSVWGQFFYWNGRIDELGFWTEVLTSDQRTTLYGAGTPPAYSTFD